MISEKSRLISRRRSKSLFIGAYLAPTLIVYLIFFILPSIDALRVSLTNWTGFGTSPQYIGLRNYSFLVRDEVFWIALGNSFIFMFAGGMFVFLFAILFAYFLTNFIKRKSIFLNIF